MAEESNTNQTPQALHEAIKEALLRHGPLRQNENEDNMIATAVVANVYDIADPTDIVLVANRALIHRHTINAVRDAIYGRLQRDIPDDGRRWEVATAISSLLDMMGWLREKPHD